MDNEQDVKEQMNGIAPPKMDRATFEHELSNIIGMVIGNTISGLLNTFNRVPPEVILTNAARIAGVIMASSVRGDLTSILTLRRELKKAFDAGVNSVDASKQISVPSGNGHRQ